MLTRRQFIDKYAPAAQEVYKKYGIFPQTVLTMAIIESQGLGPDGNYYPGLNASARLGNNYFGIKKGVGWRGPTITVPTPKDKDKMSVFRKYGSIEESFDDYGRFLNVNKRYRNGGVFDAPDFLTQMQNIAKSGYAENMSYFDLLEKVSKSVNKQLKDFKEIVDTPLKNIKEIVKKPPAILIFVALGAFILYTLNNKKNAAKIY